MIKLIERLDRGVARVEFTLLIALIAALTLILSAQVLLRYLFSSPLFWAEEVSVQILISATFIGVSYLTFADSLVRVDFLIDQLPRGIQNALIFLLRLVGFGVLVIFCYYATDWILRPEIKTDISPTTGLPRWYNYSILVGAFYCMTWHMLAKLILFRPYQHTDATGTDTQGAGGEA
ncbi:TRAP transporter small permease [Marinobacterium lutimaris]|uniref:TRAP transporter small permease protein n=1 Tax=Marinobacterium lutimaris TaxID=568106 RepID=A0A1H6BFX7_9GAMM|nr:TRAP transporter small permease [Marinobacterium lutimaris]SEG59570.1 TRAP-type C4-dicarboxylate transport system, small permease component [Marinobacterium lutimaris]